jgi:hypothetical protein
MPYQFHLYHETRTESVIHNVTLAGYPTRVFSAYLGASGELADAESRPAPDQRRQPFRSVRKDSPQWRALERAAQLIYAIETRNTESV